MEAVQEPTQRIQLNSIRTYTSSSGTVQPDVLQINSKASKAILANAPDKIIHTGPGLKLSPDTDTNTEAAIDAANSKAQSNPPPSQASVNVNGEIMNPTASTAGRISGLKETIGKNNNGQGLAPQSTVKAIKEEGRAASELLKAKARELQCLQEINRQLEKDENSAFSGHQDAMKTEHSLGLALLAAKARHESALIDLNSKESRLNTSRDRALQQSELLKQKQEEVGELKQRKRAEDRERQQRIRQQKKHGSK